MSRKYDSGSSQGRGDPNKKGTKAESKLNSPEPCKYSKVFFISIFSDKTVILLEKADCGGLLKK